MRKSCGADAHAAPGDNVFFRPNYMPSSKKHTGVNFKDQPLSRICLSQRKLRIWFAEWQVE